ncbi:MAG: cyanophycin synthetase [Bacteroidetes bacterium]|nr:cyanophycin synthetase [Bacteroidota bacterium]
MKIKDIKVMRGPNYWSSFRKKLIVAKLDLENLEYSSTEKVTNFAERLEKLIPSIYEHRCSPGVKGGFLQRVREGTWMGHVVEHVALELQTLAGMPCGFGRTRSTHKKGVYFVVFAYEVEEAGVYALKAAVNIVQHLISDTPYDIIADINELKYLCQREQFGPSTQSMINEAKKRNIPFARLNHGAMVMFGQGCNQKIINSTVTENTSNIGVDLAADKENTKQLLLKECIPVPKGTVIINEQELLEALNVIEFPVAIKPIDGNHGRGITTKITSKEQALKAFQIAKEIANEVIVERSIKGSDYRFLMINYKRIPAMIIGDDRSTIQQLIDETNSDPKRGEGHENVLTKIKVDAITQNILAEKNQTLDSVLPIGKILFLKDTANISTGGTSRDVTEFVHPDNVFMAERIARLMNLNICGIDIVAEDINVPLSAETGAVLEVNAGPGFRMHLAPSKGTARNVAAPVIEMLYPQNAPSRIPVVAVTGTNGKTTTTRLIAHLMAAAGHTVGLANTDGIYINHKLLCRGDCSGPESAAIVFRDPIVDFAVLECARGGILRAGLGFDNCNISIVTNVSSDHLGLDDIDTLDELAKVKAVVPENTFKEGYAILNADDELVYNMKDDLDCNIALFSMDSENPRIKNHCDKGGFAAVIEKEYFVICQGGWKTPIVKVKSVPLTFSGNAEFMMQNVLPSILTAILNKVEIETIKAALMTFIPSAQFTPGRMNLFRFPDFNLMVDYAHNEGSFIVLKKYLKNIDAPVKVGIVAGVGDRRDEDIRNVGYYAAQLFDEIIIRHDKDLRGRTKEEFSAMIIEGIKKVKSDAKITIVSDELEAIQYAIENAVKDSFIFVCTENVFKVVEYVTKAHEKEIVPKLIPEKIII